MYNRVVFVTSLILIAFECFYATAFAPNLPPPSKPRKCSYGNQLLPSRPTGVSKTWLSAKLWERLQIEEDPEPMWYLLNCVATNEINLLRQCREVCADMPDAIKFVVPTERKTRSHGANKMVTETKVKYPGYVFAKVRLCQEVYEAVQGLDLCRSWMGTVNRKGYKKLPPAPVALNELEVENFGLEDIEDIEDEEEEDEDSDVIVDVSDEDEVKAKIDEEALKVYQGLRVDDMVKVTGKGKFYNEDGIVRRLKEGKIFVRFYTYGSMFEEWLDPNDVRKLSNVEILKGLSGPSQPITQRDFDGPQNYGRSFDGDRPGNLRRSLMSNVKGRGGGGPRNRRQDRAAQGYKQDFFGRTDDERAREERNWNWYQDRQRRDRRGDASDNEWNMRAGSRKSREDNDDWALGDVDSQWGRKPQRQRRKEQQNQQSRRENRSNEAAIEGEDDWSAFVSSSSSPETSSGSDDFFESLMTDLSKDLDNRESKDKKASSPRDKQEEDDFFASLMSELSDEEPVAPPSPSKAQKKEAKPSADDDFFASLEAELGSAFEEGPKETSDDDADEFFANLEAELAPLTSESSSGDTATDVESKGSSFTAVAEEAPSAAESAKSETSATRESSPSSGDLSKLTVPQLKDILRERGLKVSGRKAELIERLTSATS